MARKLFGVGARGELVGDVQRALMGAGIPLPKADEIYGRDTQTAVSAFQGTQGLARTGDVDLDTWRLLMKLDMPGIDQRALQLTAAFEGHDYTLAVGNFDGAWLTWGIVGFTLKHGEVQKIIQAIDAANPALVNAAFGDKADDLRNMLQASAVEQQAWAQGLTTMVGGLAEPWKSAFAAFGNFPEVRAEQRRRAATDYFVPAQQTAARFKLASELGMALAFDVHVQNGGIGSDVGTAVQQQLAGIGTPAEKDRREAIANAVADHANPKYKEDVRARKLAIARGAGKVHERDYLLENWGLLEV